MVGDRLFIASERTVLSVCINHLKASHDEPLSARPFIAASAAAVQSSVVRALCAGRVARSPGARVHATSLSGDDHITCPSFIRFLVQKSKQSSEMSNINKNILSRSTRRDLISINLLLGGKHHNTVYIIQKLHNNHYLLRNPIFMHH